ncbi:hypothetical protein T11_17681 [Trichinella zimbabwensis]|uniref:Uncharacterized protein n=1 Tax=Trichinella zimbabwensis TaxID=268475 RepID=A0A0V1HXF6_9BILA|nr:hypothetical protein T11_17681 [Trichinella zimbabwensis]
MKYTMISYVHFCSFIFYVLITMELSYYGQSQSKHAMNANKKCQKIKKTLHCFSLLLYSMDRANSPVTD